MYLIWKLLNTVLSLFSLLLFVYVILSWLKPAANKWTELLRSIVEPVLAPIRKFLTAHLPSQLQIFDWSPVACWLLINLLRQVIDIFRYW